MCKKNPSSDSPHKQPPLTPPSTTVDQPFQPPTPSVEAVDLEIIQAIVRAVAPLKSKEHEKALNFVRDSIFFNPLSGQLHYTEGRIHLSLADNAAGDDVAKVKHLEDGVRAAQLAAELLPNSLHCARLLVDLLYDLAFFNKEWERVEEACDRGLAIEDSIDFGVRDLFGHDLDDQLRFEENLKWLEEVKSQENLEFAAKKTVEVVNTEDEEEEDSEVDINHLMMATDRRKKQIMKKLKDNNEDILRYKGFWNITLSVDKKRSFRKVNIEELENHLKSLKDKLAVDLLLEAIDFAKQHKTWKFWECYACVKKFADYELYRNHFWEVHWMGCRRYWVLSEEFMKESIDIILNGVWKPVDTNEVMKSEKGLDECKSSLVEEIPRKISKSDTNESSETSLHGPKWPFCDDIERLEILGSIRTIFLLLLKNRCLVPILVLWAIEYTEDQFETRIQLSQQYMNLGMKALQIICFLGASQLTEILTFLKDVAHTCSLTENIEMDNSMDENLNDHHMFYIKERVLFSSDLSCLLLDERVLRGELNATNYFNAVVGDDSVLSFSADECEDNVLPDSDNIVSWLYMGFNCGEVLELWTSLRDYRRRQAKKSRRVFLETISILPKICARNDENPSKLMALPIVESIFLKETITREKSKEYEPQLYMDLLKQRQKKLQEISKNSFAKHELDVISEVLKEAQEVLSRDQSGGCVEEESRVQECAKRKDNCIEKALRRLKMQLLKDLSFHDTVIFRRLAAFHQYELELTNMSVCDYRSIIMPMLKSFLQSHLKDLYEDAEEKSKAAEEALLAEVALEAEKNINNDSDNVKQKQNKKKKKKKNKNLRKAIESDEPKQLTAADEYLENQRQFEHEASLEANASGTGNEAADNRE
ncbi:hypothetical protein ACOSQ4_029412 [Xanthoceras sorbifolium]